MENKSIPTAEYFINKKFEEKFGEDFYDITYINNESNSGLVVEEFLFKVAREYAVLFAKHHRGKAIEAIKEKAELKYSKDGCLYINPDSIENAYSEDEIK